MKLLVSRCLLGEPCRYDGRVKTDLRPPLRAAGIGDDCWISVCPESDGGLPTPRTPSEIRGTARGVLEGRDHIMAADGRDNTACFMKGARIAADLCRENGVSLIFSHANEQPMKTMRRAGFVDLVGEDHFRANIDDAIAYARELLGEERKAA